MADNWISIQLEQGQRQSRQQAHSFFIIDSVAGQVQGYQTVALLQLLYVIHTLKLVPCKHKQLHRKQSGTSKYQL